MKDKAIAALNKITKTPNNKALLMVLNELLNDPALSSQAQMNTLLGILCNNKLPDIINYIISLKVIPLPGKVTHNSFFARKPISDQHARCMVLFNNLSTVKVSASSLWELANTLLHSALSLYPKLELVEVDLDDNIVDTTPQNHETLGVWPRFKAFTL